MTDRVDVAIVGAGVVGLAVAKELSRARQVVVLERHESYGLENSSHNSGVVHAGIYYPRDWLKTRLCIEGNRLLYAWAAEADVRAHRCGKLVIAVEEDELPALDALHRAARENGVPELELLSGQRAREMEPSVRAVGALWSGSSGVIDQMALMRSYAKAAEANGAILAYKHDVTQIERTADGCVVRGVDPAGGEVAIEASVVVNSAGMAADRVAALLGYPLDGDEATPRLRQRLVKGRYYDIVDTRKAAQLTHLVYPLPHGDRAGLGVHVTLDIDGGAHLGPDTEWLDEGTPTDYRSDDTRREAFLESARRYLPWLEAEDIAPGQVGYRTKLHDPGEPAQDFLIWRDRGYVHLGGVESPGMTASLAIAREVARLAA
jgi:L-2-hydroxyglutarate oxidase LhgO